MTYNEICMALAEAEIEVVSDLIFFCMKHHVVGSLGNFILYE